MSTLQKRKFILLTFVAQCFCNIDNIDAILYHWTARKLTEVKCGAVLKWLCQTLTTAKISLHVVDSHVYVWNDPGLAFPVEILTAETQQLFSAIIDDWSDFFRRKIVSECSKEYRDSALDEQDLSCLQPGLFVARWVGRVLLNARGDDEDAVRYMFVSVCATFKEIATIGVHGSSSSRDEGVRKVYCDVLDILLHRTNAILTRSWDYNHELVPPSDQ